MLPPQVDAVAARLRAAAYAVRAAAPLVPPGGSFTFTGGVSSDRPVRGAWVSGVATAAADQMARVLAVELAPLRFNAVSPGWTDTPMLDRVLGDGKADVLAGVAQGLLTRRIATAGEVAEAVVFLMANRSVTGEVLHVDGGGRLA